MNCHNGSPDAADAAWLAAEQDAADAERSAAQIAAEMAQAARAAEHHAAARRVHIAGDLPSARLDDVRGVHPRGLHVPCAGDPDADPPTAGCGAPPRVACSHPTRGEIPGFVHPTRLNAERAWAAGIASATANV